MEVLLTEVQKETGDKKHTEWDWFCTLPSFKKIEVPCSLSGPLFAMATGHLRVCSLRAIPDRDIVVVEMPELETDICESSVWGASWSHMKGKVGTEGILRLVSAHR